ncbi:MULTISPECIES: hypothetical protein [unclassified Pseudonocardia]|uniref:hypothetical protein n=1 Tax=unclassified Pseudonocardia TaxID=2619320 RepID=UPI00095E1DBD|nr:MULTISPECIES: hypothetical protein [unclassified Pseudonocardia]MBN9099849.1 hypothetical protein [Pseudonocardia sp.]OJY43943.1 MAG: hypothetical protein BGP03_06570 [Pseudonocardia sp. 73-21]
MSEARVGHRFPGGRAVVEPYVDLLVRDVVGAPPPSGDGIAHPTVAFLAAQGGLGIELGELFALFGISADDGPMLGEWAAEFAEPLRVGAAYAVTGVVEAQRRTSGRSGVLDLVTVRIELAGADGRVHATVRPTYVFPHTSAQP